MILKNVTTKELSMKLISFVQQIKKKDTRFLFYFSGNGYNRILRNGQEQYILATTECHENEKDYTKGFTMQHLQNIAKSCVSNGQIYIADSRFSGTMIIQKGTPELQHKIESLVRLSQHPTQQILTSCGREMKNKTNTSSSNFTDELCSLLTGETIINTTQKWLTFSQIGHKLKTLIPKQLPQCVSLQSGYACEGEILFTNPCFGHTNNNNISGNVCI